MHKIAAPQNFREYILQHIHVKPRYYMPHRGMSRVSVWLDANVSVSKTENKKRERERERKGKKKDHLAQSCIESQRTFSEPKLSQGSTADLYFTFILSSLRYNVFVSSLLSKIYYKTQS